MDYSKEIRKNHLFTKATAKNLEYKTSEAK